MGTKHLNNRKSRNRKQLREKTNKVLNLMNLLVSGNVASATEFDIISNTCFGIINSNKTLKEIHKLLVK